MKIQSAVKWHGLPKNYSLNIGRKFLPFRHWCVVNQHRNHRNITFKRRCDLQPNKVVRIVYSTGSVSLFAEPVRADYREDKIGAIGVRHPDPSAL